MKLRRGLVLAAVGLLALVGCGAEDKSETAYGIVHKDYVGFATVSINAEKKVSKVVLDEAFLPHTWAATKVNYYQEDKEVPATVLDIKTSAADAAEEKHSYFSKFISIDGKVFEASVYDATEAKADGTTKQIVKYSNKEIANLYNYLKADANGAWYVSAIKAKKVFASDDKGTKIDLAVNDANWFKSEGTYWATASGTQKHNWRENMEELVKGMIGDNMQNAPVKGEDGYYKFGDTATTATLSDALHYYTVAKLAFEKVSK